MSHGMAEVQRWQATEKVKVIGSMLKMTYPNEKVPPIKNSFIHSGPLVTS